MDTFAVLVQQALANIIGERPNDEKYISVFLAQVPPSWRQEFSMKFGFFKRANRVLLLAHVLDVRFAMKRPADAAEAVHWVCGRIKAKFDPSDRSYKKAKQLWKEG